MKLRPFKKYHFLTLPACPGQGYISESWVEVVYLPKKAQFVLIGEYIRLQLDKNQWSVVFQEIEEVQARISAAGDDESKARNQGRLASEMLENLAIENRWSYENF